jgi:hypothetical protein
VVPQVLKTVDHVLNFIVSVGHYSIYTLISYGRQVSKYYAMMRQEAIHRRLGWPQTRSGRLITVDLTLVVEPILNHFTGSF